MSVINTNVSAMYSQNAMKTNARVQATAMEQLSTGVRVNSAKDDAAGLAIGQNMTSQIRGLNQAVRNLNDGINMMQTAEGAMVEQSNMLQRMRELAVQSMNGTYSDTQRGYLDKEFQALTEQIQRISTDTMWNDQKLLAGGGYLATTNSTVIYMKGAETVAASGAAVKDYLNQIVVSGTTYYPASQLTTGVMVMPAMYGALSEVPSMYSGIAVPVFSTATAGATPIGYTVPTNKLHATFTVQAGKDEDQTIKVDVGPMNMDGFGLSGIDIATFDTATATLDKISTALEKINNQRAGIGAAINQMAFGADNLTNVSSNATQSRSTIMDTDYALATTQLAKTQIIQQAATAMLAQANQQPQSVMALLKG
jgi:flagellin